MKDASTPNISVNVRTTYIEEQSNPEQDHYVFAYTINIQNHGDITAKLLTRHWIITDANGKNQEIHGSGVVGEQPYLQPGASFEYTSGTILDTPLGFMKGSYQMLGDDGKTFDTEIPSFTLSQPNCLH